MALKAGGCSSNLSLDLAAKREKGNPEDSLPICSPGRDGDEFCRKLVLCICVDTLYDSIQAPVADIYNIKFMISTIPVGPDEKRGETGKLQRYLLSSFNRPSGSP